MAYSGFFVSAARELKPLVVAAVFAFGISPCSLADTFYQWQTRNFSGEQLATPAGDGIVGEGDDPDHDGRANIIEYVFGLNPWKFDLPPVEFSLVTEKLQVTFQPLISAADARIVVQVRSSLDSGKWASGSNATEEIENVAVGERRRITVRDKTGASGSATRFMRLVVMIDSDGDGLPDATEYGQGTNPYWQDSDGDGVIDGEDGFPLDPTRWELPTPPDDTTPPVITLTEPASAVPAP